MGTDRLVGGHRLELAGDRSRLEVLARAVLQQDGALIGHSCHKESPERCETRGASCWVTDLLKTYYSTATAGTSGCAAFWRTAMNRTRRITSITRCTHQKSTSEPTMTSVTMWDNAVAA